MFQKQKLSNNLTLLTSPMTGSKSVTAMVMVGAGSRYETKKINGLSHFLEHMAFKGTKKRPTAKHISEEIDSIGGEFNAFTSKDHTAYYVKAASEHLPLILDVLSDMMTNSLFKEEEIEREKGVIIEEINMYEDTPMRKVAEVFETLMFGDCPMGWDIAGTAEIIRSIKRVDFVNYISSLYKTSNMVVSIAGGIDNFNVGAGLKPALSRAAGATMGGSKTLPYDKKENNKLNNIVEKYFSGLKDGKTIDFPKVKFEQSSPKLKIHFKKTEQAHLCLGFPSFSNTDKRRYALSVLTTILGGGMSSRLFTEVRERRGLCYYVHASNDSYRDTGDFVVSAGVDLKRIDDAIKVILEQLYLVIPAKAGILRTKIPDRASLVRNDKKQGEVTVQELRKAKEYIKGHTILGLEDSESVAGLYASQFILKDKIETPEEILYNIEKVTMDEVYSVAKDIFDPKRINLAVIGPFEDSSRFEKLIK